MHNWHDLAQLRKRGQRPMGLVYLADDWRVRRAIENNYGLWALPLPKAEECYLLAGLWAVMFTDRNDRTQQVAWDIAAVHPKHFSIGWKGERWDQLM